MPSGKAGFEKLLDSAISPMLLEPNWVINLEICDAVRQNDVPVKYALQAIRKRMKDTNPHITKYALVVLETCVKNCGETFHEEIATHDFMNEMRTLAQTGSAPVKEQVLSMVQAWNHAFRNNTKYQPILATYNLMKMEGCNFPPLNESDAMFTSSTAPAWKDGDVCHLCRVKFGTFTRQHHCRACGEVFCGSCSAKKSIIPKLGIEREVRVCDPCFDDINPNASKPQTSSNEEEDELPAEYLNSALFKETQTKPKPDDADAKAQEEDELQLALALSLSQQEANKNIGKSMSAPPAASTSTAPSVTKSNKSTPIYNSPYTSAISSLQQAEEPVSELDKYLDRSYWEKKSQEKNISSVPSAPEHEQPSVNTAIEPHTVHTVVAYNGAYGGDSEDEESEETFASDAFVNTMEKSVALFVDHMNKAHMKGKHIAMDTSVQSLFHSLSAMHPQLLQLIEDEEDSKAKYQAMLEKLAIVREARDTLDDMRAQHQEKVRQQELEQEMLRRMQMEQKLELMRQQKQEYLEYQRQLQIQRQMELDNYQKEKMLQKQVLPQDGFSATYPAVPATSYPSTMQQQQYTSLPYTAPTGDASSTPYAGVPPKQAAPQQTFQQYPSKIQQPGLPNGDKSSLHNSSQYSSYQQQHPVQKHSHHQQQQQQMVHPVHQNVAVTQPPAISSQQPPNPTYAQQQPQMYKQEDWQQPNEPGASQNVHPGYGHGIKPVQQEPPIQQQPQQPFYQQPQQYPATPQNQTQTAIPPPQHFQSPPPSLAQTQQVSPQQQPQHQQHQQNFQQQSGQQYPPPPHIQQMQTPPSNSYPQQNQAYVAQGNAGQQGFQQVHPNSQPYQQQPQFEESLSGNMKDLQLISFD